MSNFCRGLTDTFVEQLKKMDWWSNVALDRELFIGVRKNYINIYYRGCSIAKVIDDGIPTIEVHYKYLIPPRLRSPYFRISSPRGDSYDKIEKSCSRDMGDIENIKRASFPYAGIEKIGIKHILKKNNNVLDVEVAFSSEDSTSETKGIDVIEPKFSKGGGISTHSSTQRVDLAALRERNHNIELVFYEAKIFTDSRIRAQGKKLPPVIEKQITPYAELLRRDVSAVKKSYRIIAENLVSLRRRESLSELICRISDGADFSVNTDPHLIVFGFDSDQRDGSKGRALLKKLQKLLPGQVLLAGNPSDINLA